MSTPKLSESSKVVVFKRWYLLVIGAFYFGQGYVFSTLVIFFWRYIFEELGATSRSQAVGLAGLIVIPWYIKIIFGILSDYFPIMNYRRRPYFIIAALFSIFGWLTLGIHTTINLFFILSAFTLAIGSAMSDSVIDALAVEITPPEFIGRLQGIAWGNRGLGLGIAGISSGQLVEFYGWSAMFQVSAFFGIMITLVVFLLPEVPHTLDFVSQPRFSYIKSTFKVIFTFRDTLTRISFLFFSGFVLSLVPLLSVIAENDFGYNVGKVGFFSLFFAIGAFIGAVFQGYYTDNQEDSSRVFLTVSIFAIIAVLAPLLTLINRSDIVVGIIFTSVGLLSGAYESYQLRIIQEQTLQSYEGTMFSLWTGISNLGQLLAGSIIVVSLAEILEIPVIFAMQILIPVVLICILLLNRLKFRYPQDQRFLHELSLFEESELE